MELQLAEQQRLAQQKRELKEAQIAQTKERELKAMEKIRRKFQQKEDLAQI